MKAVEKNINAIYLAIKRCQICVLVFIILSLTSCEKVFEVYVGFPMQPENINSEYQPGYNVFGMCKAGKLLYPNNQFFEVQYLPHIFDTISDITYHDAIISISQKDNTYILKHQEEGVYFNQTLWFEPGQTWTYKCIADTFVITSSTIIPNMPDVSNIILHKKKISFHILSDSSAFMYEITYVDDDGYANKRVVPDANTYTKVELDIDFHENSTFNFMYVIAYDKNYERYLTTSNIFFKPNAYRPRFTTVNGGYGCFGSLTSKEIDLKAYSN